MDHHLRSEGGQLSAAWRRSALTYLDIRSVLNVVAVEKSNLTVDDEGFLMECTWGGWMSVSSWNLSEGSELTKQRTMEVDDLEMKIGHRLGCWEV